MKFDFTPTQLVLFAICFAAIITAHKLTPGGSAEAVVSLASSIITFMLKSPLTKGKAGDDA